MLCALTFGQASYVGRAQYSGPMDYGVSACGPGNGYACMNQTTGVVNFSVTSAPNWGANTCNWASIYTVETCGNLYGAGTVQTPADFGTAMIRGTDLGTFGSAATIFETFNDPYPNTFELNNQAVIAKQEAQSVHVFVFNSTTGVAMKTSPDISIPGNANWSFTQPLTLFTYTLSPGVVDLHSNAVNLTPGSAALTPTLMFHWFASNCLTNSVNGYTGGNFASNAWNGVMTQSLDDTTFAMAFSSTANQGSGVYVAIWSIGQAGCDVYNSILGTVTHNGVLVGSVPAGTSLIGLRRKHEREDLRGDTLGGSWSGDPARLLGALRAARHGVGAGVRTVVRIECVVGDAEATPLVERAVEQQPRARGIAREEPWLIEEGRAHSARRVGHRRLHEGAHPTTAHRARADRAYLHEHGRLLALFECRDCARATDIPRQVFEQLSHGPDAERVKPLGEPFRNALQRALERRPRPAKRRGDHLLGGQPLGRSEGARKRRARHRIGDSPAADGALPRSGRRCRIERLHAGCGHRRQSCSARRSYRPRGAARPWVTRPPAATSRPAGLPGGAPARPPRLPVARPLRGPAAHPRRQAR